MISCIPKIKAKVFFAFLFSLVVSFGALAQGAAEQAQVSDEGVVPGAAEGAVEAANAGGLPVDDPAIVSAGNQLFKNNCAVCHSAGSDVIVGPGLAGINERRSQDWLLKWIKNSQALIQAGDAEAVAVYNEYNKQAMPSFNFKDEEIVSILTYIKSAEAEVAAVPTTVGSGEDQPAGENVGTDAIGAVGNYLDIILVVLILVLIVLIVTLLLISSVLKGYLNKNRQLDEFDNEVVNQRFDFSKIYKSKVVRSLVGLIFVVVLLDLTLGYAMGVGIQQGYQPKQPIAFSHKLHAGEHQINCNYCHTTVYESQSASIPSANICMNCHSQIKTESPEIQKIYRAIERGRPIEWVRIHNLPDLAYFNHSQHTQVGGVECETCHGPIQEMDVVYQYSPLTMGWCINCHRETPLNTEGNGYYDKLVELHEKSSRGTFTVASNGGTECARCHY
ncbi:quinol:cytochrome c oxidoreductase pentaheme cytochrome subunit [Pontibacter ummariensis]|uniref:Quinol:cytochrome c oxidoreductase pentaheme cytochrome subunit n=1 Tax=Pontibacter ummariensis TaxID=1610492 RepID=A0A239KVP8_9BACT|nr:cytochrome c3 family protein [Pontibacter ummariensis]PRY04957.1 quinol:cytochrome c oxidoreductase pentaheme cytochrome subunit [Pontibacter ummariensis]SNT22105.1 quinol:cytochrome c oxidoreductase pentaheme cytochrome subunit [Pontibacter ummariensis]